MFKLNFALAVALAITSPALAQTGAPSQRLPGPGNGSGVIIGGQNNTGGGVDVTIPRGATGADTYQSNSAAAGNANQPSRAVPQGSGGGGNGGGSGQ